jgi:hypothetical protein
MELTIKTDDENSFVEIIAFAKKLNNVTVVERTKPTVTDSKEREELWNSILNFKRTDKSSFGDAVEWQRNERKDRDLPFSEL